MVTNGDTTCSARNVLSEPGQSIVLQTNQEEWCDGACCDPCFWNAVLTHVNE